ncbi:hypothetical protein KUV85_14175 [Nocardioides panacisoli]|uniref:hypothetical protein n=1 Tax=Nocardioides panacisoli TaxID=627624 RepID=UPI001C6278A4|nr:hypothetical protein [Nocardioides panacisoli]QYJ03464.1 hypothetical protein KUV85_14175 [Nocardioides panacisoli]
MTTLDTAGVRRAWGWVAALRGGSATPWSQWAGEAGPSAGELPGAHQLELLRRLNAARPGGVPAALAERVLAADLPGRGRRDVPLAGAGEPRFGPAPVDPGDLAPEELLRLASGLLAEDLAGCSVPPDPWPRRRPWAPSYALAGDPWHVAHLRSELGRRGRPERPAPRRVYVVAEDLATQLAHAWTARAFAESGTGWPAWLGRFVAHDLLPRRADPLEPAREWAARLGPERVTLVTEPALLRQPLRLRRLSAPPPVTAEGVDLARRISTTLGILVPTERRTDLLRGVLLPRLPQDPRSVVTVPPAWQEWVQDRARRIRDEALAEGYPVLGDPDRLVPQATSEGRRPVEVDVLAAALDLLLDPVTARTEAAR